MMRKLVFATVGVLLAVSLAGCSLPLASPSQPTSSESDVPLSTFTDKLIGVYMTTEPLDLAPDQKVYATKTEASIGGTVNPQYTFEGLDEFFMFRVSLPDGNGSSVQSGSSLLDVAIGDSTNLDTSTGITTTTATLTGTMQVAGSNDASIFTLYANPVYQTIADQVYLSQGGDDQTIAFSRDNVQASLTPSFSLTVTQTTTLTDHGKTTIYDAAITFKVNLIKQPQQIVVLDMGADNTPLSRTEYDPGTLPDSRTPPTGTAYIILETTAVDSSVDRRILSPDDTIFVTYAARPDGACIGYPTTLNWP